MQTLAEGAEMLRFLFVADAELELDEAAVAKHLGEAGQQVLAAAIAGAGAGRPTGPPRPSRQALRAELIERLELKPRIAFGPLRVAVTGRQVSPPLFESMQLLGRDSSLARLRGRRPAERDSLDGDPDFRAGRAVG